MTVARHPRGWNDRGSVLIEAMVAIAIVAGVLAATYRSLGEAALRARSATAARTAILIARSRLAAVGVETPLAAGEEEGAEGGFDWRLDVAPEAAADSVTGSLWRVAVVVRDAGGIPRARLTSLRLGPGG